MDEVGVAETLSAVARSLEAEPDLDRTLSAIVSAAVQTVPGAEHGGVSLLEGGVIRTVAASSEVIGKLDELEHELGEGPCSDAVSDQSTYRTEDLTQEDRWPRFAPRACALGVRAMLGFRLFTQRHTLGSLNLYAGEVGAFGEEAAHIGEIFASHASVAVAGAKESAQLHTALSRRDTISMAKGILVHQHRVSPKQAFDMLLKASQESNIKLFDVANWLVESTVRGGE